MYALLTLNFKRKKYHRKTVENSVYFKSRRNHIRKGGNYLLNHILLFFVAIGIGIVGAIIGWEFSTVMILIVSLTLLNIGYYLYIVFNSKNVKKLEKIIESNKKDPMYGYLWALKNEDIKIAIENLDTLMEKYKKKFNYHAYGYIKEILLNNYEGARKHAEEMKDTPIGKYSLAAVDAYEGNAKQHFNTSFSKPWMLDSIKATHYYIHGDYELYKNHRDLVIAQSKGIQLLSNIYVYKIFEKTK